MTENPPTDDRQSRPDDQEDPFDRLEAADDDEGDPFDRLDGEPEERPADAFEAVDVDAVDEDAVWAQVTGEPREVDPGDEEAVVPKRRYCERCEFFSEPPAVACENDGTEIVELVDTDHFRVVGCPVVARRREMGEFDVEP